jgi:hypothetical protein
MQIPERFPSDLKDRKTPGLGYHQDVATTEDEGNDFGLNVFW